MSVLTMSMLTMSCVSVKQHCHMSVLNSDVICQRSTTIWYVVVDRFYIALFPALEQTHCARILHEWLAFFYSAFFGYPPKWCTYSAGMACTTWNCCRLGAFCVHAPCHFMQNQIRKIRTCLAVTCHLHFWLNDWDLLRVTSVTRGWNKYQTKSQHRKLTPEKKILLLLLQGLEPATF